MGMRFAHSRIYSRAVMKQPTAFVSFTAIAWPLVRAANASCSSCEVTTCRLCPRAAKLSSILPLYKMRWEELSTIKASGVTFAPKDRMSRLSLSNVEVNCISYFCLKRVIVSSVEEAFAKTPTNLILPAAHSRCNAFKASVALCEIGQSSERKTYTVTPEATVSSPFVKR